MMARVRYVFWAGPNKIFVYNQKCLDQVELRFLYKTKSILTGSKNKIFCVKTKMFGPSQNNSGPTKGQIILQICTP